MQINRQNLQKALEIVKPGLSNKEIIEQTTSFAFIDGKVVTYNDEISICHPVEGLTLEGAVKADSGWFEEELNFRYNGDPISFIITPYLLRGILSETLECTLSEQKLKFEGENWVYVTALKQTK